jgi:hypothetical protein
MGLKMTLNRNAINSLRLQRQGFTLPVGKKEYDLLFQRMSPVPTIYWCEPGSPPTLPLHTDMDDYDYNSRRRAKREILKGRYAGGTIAYVTKEDLELYACLYKKELNQFSQLQIELLELLNQEGPMNIGLMKEITGLLVKEITPELHKLQEAFLVYEDQLDMEGDRGWYIFENEFPEVNINRYSKKDALKLALPRFASLMVFFNEAMIKSYYKLPLKLIKEAVSELIKEGILLNTQMEEQEGYILAEDLKQIKSDEIAPVEPQVLLIQRNDFLARAYADQLKKAFPSEWDALYYLLIDGTFHGVVVGRFKFGPHRIEDILLDLPTTEQVKRKEEILAAVYKVFDPIGSPVRRYCGTSILT